MACWGWVSSTWRLSGRGPVAQQSQQALWVDGLVPGRAFRLKAVGRGLDEQDARTAIIGQVSIQGQVVGNCQNRFGNGYVAGFEAGIALDDIRIDAGHGRGVAKDQDVAVAI